MPITPLPITSFSASTAIRSLQGVLTFTKAVQEKNAENLLIIREQVLVARNGENWQAHAQHSRLYVGRGGANYGGAGGTGRGPLGTKWALRPVGLGGAISLGV
jgi:hypothetical protein